MKVVSLIALEIRRRNNFGKLYEYGLKICWCLRNSEVIITTAMALYNSVLTWTLLMGEGTSWDCLYARYENIQLTRAVWWTMLEAWRSGLYKEHLWSTWYFVLYTVDTEIFLATSIMELENYSTHLWNKHKLTLRSWTGYLISIFFHFLVWKMGIITSKSYSVN